MVRSFPLIRLFMCLTAGYALSQIPQASSQAAVPEHTADTPASSHMPTLPQEDWSKLAVDRSVLKPILNGLVLSSAETPNYTLEIVRLEWRLHDHIDITVVKPRNVKKPRVALYLYSYPSDIDLFRDDNWCQAVTHDGMAAVGFVSALTGERFKGRPMREWFVPELQESVGSTVHDVQLILDYLEGRGDLSAEKVGMFGQGSGGAIAILAAAADPRIRAIDVLNPWGDWPDWLKSSPRVADSERSSLLTPEFLQKAATVEPLAFLPGLKDRALRVQQTIGYPNTPPAARDKIAEAVPAAELVQYKDRAAQAEAWRTAGPAGWLAHQLDPASESQAAVPAAASKPSPR